MGNYSWDCTLQQDVLHLNDYMLLTAKPVIYAVNMSEPDYKRKKNKYLVKIHQWIQAQAGGGIMIPYSGMAPLS